MGDKTPLRRFCWRAARLEVALKALKALPPVARQLWLPQLYTEYDAVGSCANQCVNKVKRVELPPLVLSAWLQMAERDVDIEHLDFSRLSETNDNGVPNLFPAGALEWHDGRDEDRWWMLLVGSAPGVSPRTGPENLVQHEGSLHGPQQEPPLSLEYPPTEHGEQVRENHGPDHSQRTRSAFDDPGTENAEQVPVERGSADCHTRCPEIQRVPSRGKRKRGEVESLVRSSNIEHEDTTDEEEGNDDRPILQKSVVPIQVEAGPSARVYRVDRQVAQSANDPDNDISKGQKDKVVQSLVYGSIPPKHRHKDRCQEAGACDPVDRIDNLIGGDSRNSRNARPQNSAESQSRIEQGSVDADGTNDEHGPGTSDMVHEELEPALEQHDIDPSRLGHRRSQSTTNPAKEKKRKQADLGGKEAETESPQSSSKRDMSGPEGANRTRGQSSVLDTTDDAREPPSKRMKQMSTGKQAVNDVVDMVTQPGDNQAVFIGKEREGKEVLRDPVYLEWVETIKKIKLSKCDYCNRNGLTCKENLACQSCPTCSRGKKTCSHRAKDAGTGTKKVYRPHQYLSVLKLHAAEPYPTLPDTIALVDATSDIHTRLRDAPSLHPDTLAPDGDHHHATSSSSLLDSSLKHTRAQTRKMQGLGDMCNATVESASTIETNPSRNKGKQPAVYISPALSRVSPPLSHVSSLSSHLSSPEANILSQKLKDNQKAHQVLPSMHSFSSQATFSTPNPRTLLSEAAFLQGHMKTILTDIKRMDSDIVCLTGVCQQIRFGQEQVEAKIDQLKESMDHIEKKLDCLLALKHAQD